MTDSDPLLLSVNGEPPELRGQVCEGFLCAAFEYEGVVEETANVTYLRFCGQWFRLYFDCGIIFWRPYNESPKAWAVEEKSWSYPLVDLAKTEGIVGAYLEHYDMLPTESGSEVHFHFTSGRRVLLRNANDNTHYEVI